MEKLTSARYGQKISNNGNATVFYPVFNKPPKYEKGEFVITGEIKKGVFESKYLVVKFEAREYPDGKYWAKIKVGENPVKLAPIVSDKPQIMENEVLLYGKTDAKGKYESKFLNQKLNTEKLDAETAYWAKLTVVSDKTQFFNVRDKQRKMPKPKKSSVFLYGKVKDGVFSSKIYSCQTEVDDGKYNALLEVDIEHINFYKVKNDDPQSDERQISIVGNVKDGDFQPNVGRKHFYEAGTARDGLHWAIFEMKSNPYEFTIVENPKPNEENGELLEGTVSLASIESVDKDTGEVLQEEKKFFFPAKDRGDHRHHAIDALVVALTQQSHIQKLSTFNANKEEKKRGNQFDKAKLNFSMPWEGFKEDAEKYIRQILVSHKKVNRTLTKKRTKDPKTGKVYEGIGARGQLHKEFVFGKRRTPNKETAYHIRKSLSEIRNNKHINKIADDGIKKLIRNHLKANYPNLNLDKDFDVPADAFFTTDENGIKQPRLFLPNKNGEPVPVKKVRIREEIGNAELLKNDINQYVNPRKNHHVLIYKDENGNLKEDVVTFWKAVERKKQNQPVVQLPEDGREIVTTLQINDMFLLNLEKEEINLETSNYEFLSQYLYKVQKLAGGDYFREFCFRKHIDARSDKEAKVDYVYIKNFGNGVTGWKTYNPIKVKITPTDKIEKI